MQDKETPFWAQPVTCPFCGFQDVMYIKASRIGLGGKGKRIQGKSKPPASGPRKHTCTRCHQEFPLSSD